MQPLHIVLTPEDGFLQNGVILCVDLTQSLFFPSSSLQSRRDAA
jgi:hypothetical protein